MAESAQERLGGRVTTFHPSCRPCPSWGTPHRCYACSCAASADTYGANAIALALEGVGVPCTVEQTGGFTMVVHVYGASNKAHTRWLAITQDGVAYDDENDAFACLSPDWMKSETYDGKLTPERLAEICAVVKTNLSRLSTEIP